MEPRPWLDRYHWSAYTTVRTFPQRCYWTPLHIAAAWGNDKLVNMLLDNGAYINSLSRLFCQCATPPSHWHAPLWTPLHTAMCHGHESTTRLLLSRGASTNVTTRYRGRDEDQDRFTALHSACIVNNLDAARALVDGGYQTNVEVYDHGDLTPLVYAFFRGDWAMIDFLLEHGADIDVRIGSLNALGYACLLGYYAEALRLLDLGATPEYEFGKFGEPRIYFHLIAVAGAPDCPSSRASKQAQFRLELVNRLIKYGIDVNQPDVHDTIALVEAASFHRVDVVKALLHSGADVRAKKSPFSMCAFEKATSLDSEQSRKTSRGAMLNTVRALLDAMTNNPAPRLMDVEPVDVDTKESDTEDDFVISSALRMLCSLPYKHEDKLEVVALLLGYKRAVEIATEGRNLVYDSILATNFNIANLLLDSGFDRPCEKQFEYLIQEFLKYDVAEGLFHILSRFPDIAPRIRNAQLLYDAVENGSEECAELLINEGVSINYRNEDGRSLLFAACMVGDTHTAELLLKNGADPNECTQEGDSLTTVAAVNENRGMIRLLLDYGASIHSSPPGQRPGPLNVGFLDMAISCGLVEAAREIVHHKNFGSPTDEEISRYWQTIISAPYFSTHHVVMLGILLGSKGFDANQIFTITDDEPGSIMATTPLHLCAAVSILVNKIGIIKELINNGADIHKLLVRPDSQAYNLNPGSKSSSVGDFDGTTPLGWAIEFSPIRAVRAFLEEEVLWHGQFSIPVIGNTETTRTDLMLLYAKAACRRQKPQVLSLLLKQGLDRSISDEEGNTMVHMICDNVETYWPNDEPKWTMECIAERAAFSLIACLKWGVKYQLRNTKGISGMDRVLQILKYSGNCEFHQTLAKHWCEKIDYVEGSSPRLTAKFAALDDTDDEEELDDEESDEESDGDDSGYEPSDAEPNLN
ncbi:ankyrin repeat-containing domain protein, partial [Xylaria cf. heliscus]